VKTTTSSGKIMESVSLGLSGRLIYRFLVEQRPINAVYCSKLLKGRVKPDYLSKRRGWLVKSVCLLHDNARPHTATVTRGTL